MGAFGEGLKSEREKRKITLDEVANATKISTRMLRAIEQEKFDLLPGGIFNKSFVRSYARHLGLNEDEIVGNYLEAFRASHPQEQIPLSPEAEARKIMEQRIHLQQEQPRAAARVPWGIVALALLLVALGLVLWNLRSKSEATAPAVVFVKPDTNSAPTASSASPVSTEPPKPVAETRSIAPDAGSSPGVPAPSSGSFRVIIRAHEDSWIQITADGKEILEDTITGQSEKSINAHNELTIKAGNIGGLEFWFNGQKLPPQGEPDQVKTLTFDSAGIVASTTHIQPPASTVER